MGSARRRDGGESREIGGETMTTFVIELNDFSLCTTFSLVLIFYSRELV